jgi:hypothetical protein
MNGNLLLKQAHFLLLVHKQFKKMLLFVQNVGNRTERPVSGPVIKPSARHKDKAD